MFTLKQYEYCDIYYNPYEDIELIVGTVDYLGCDVYVVDQNIFSCLYIKDAIKYIESLGVKFEVVKGGS